MAITRTQEFSSANSSVWGTAALSDVITNHGFPYVSLVLKTVAVNGVSIQASNDGTNYVELTTVGAGSSGTVQGIYPFRFFKVVPAAGATVASIAYSFTRGAK